MARKKKSDYAEAERRYRAMRAREAAGPKRSLGDMLDLRLRIMADIATTAAEVDSTLDEVYGGAMTPKSGTLNGYRNERHLVFDTGSETGYRLAVTTFGWSSDPGHLPEPRFLRCWNKSFYAGYDDKELIRRLIGRVPTSEIDGLTAAFEVAEALKDNDEDLARRFDRVSRRQNQLFFRLRAVELAIGSAVTCLLEEKVNWRMRQGQKWTRVLLDDGSVITVTDTGTIMFGDRITDVPMSLNDRPSKKPYGSQWALRDRQRRAQERK